MMLVIRCLESLISACGRDANSYIDRDFIEIIACTVTSDSRFVRESTFTLLTALVATNLTTGQFVITFLFFFCLVRINESHTEPSAFRFKSSVNGDISFLWQWAIIFLCYHLLKSPLHVLMLITQ